MNNLIGKIMTLMKYLHKMSMNITGFSTEYNENVYYVDYPDTIEKMCLNGFVKVKPTHWPKNLKYLKTNFRPDFDNLPDTLQELKIVTQEEVRKEYLPKNLEKLHIKAPNSMATTFNVKNDNFDLYRISIIEFGKYNMFSGAYDNNDADNIRNYKVFYHYQVDGDDQTLPFNRKHDLNESMETEI